MAIIHTAAISRAMTQTNAPASKVSTISSDGLKAKTNGMRKPMSDMRSDWTAVSSGREPAIGAAAYAASATGGVTEDRTPN